MTADDRLVYGFAAIACVLGMLRFPEDAIAAAIIAVAFALKGRR